MDKNPYDPDQYEAGDRDLLPPQLPTSLAARVVRFLNQRFPRAYGVVTLAPRVLVSRFWLRKLERASAGQALSRLDFGHHRTSDTVFIFGTGASINDYPADWWDVVRAHDSIGMNFFLLHEHVPTLQVMEDVHGIRAQLLQHRYVDRADYENVPLIVKTQLTNLSSERVGERIDELRHLPGIVRDRTYLSVDLLAAGKTRSDMENSYRLLARLGMWTPKRHFLFLSKRRGSVSYVINLAVRAGYRKVVLCGVDLNHTEYFYDSRRPEFAAAGLPVPINDEYGQVHSTNDPNENPVTIHEVILAIKHIILEPMGVELTVGSQTSALHPEVPQFDWETAPRQAPEITDPSGQGGEGE